MCVTPSCVCSLVEPTVCEFSPSCVLCVTRDDKLYAMNCTFGLFVFMCFGFVRDAAAATDLVNATRPSVGFGTLELTRPTPTTKDASTRGVENVCYFYQETCECRYCNNFAECEDFCHGLAEQMESVVSIIKFTESNFSTFTKPLYNNHNLSRIHLTNNGEMNLAKDFFEMYPNVQNVNFDNNNLKGKRLIFNMTAHARFYSFSSKFSELDYFPNFIQSNSLTLIDVSMNNIKNVSGINFSEIYPKLEDLDLKNNELEDLDIGFLNYVIRVANIWLDNNPFNCSCKIKTLYESYKNSLGREGFSCYSDDKYVNVKELLVCKNDTKFIDDMYREHLKILRNRYPYYAYADNPYEDVLDPVYVYGDYDDSSEELEDDDYEEDDAVATEDPAAKEFEIPKVYDVCDNAMQPQPKCLLNRVTRTWTEFEHPEFLNLDTKILYRFVNAAHAIKTNVYMYIFIVLYRFYI